MGATRNPPVTGSSGPIPQPDLRAAIAATIRPTVEGALAKRPHHVDELDELVADAAIDAVVAHLRACTPYDGSALDARLAHAIDDYMAGIVREPAPERSILVHRIEGTADDVRVTSRRQAVPE